MGNVLRVYLDTSVIGGCRDPEFARWSRALLDDVVHGRRIAVLSDITLLELESAPAEVRQVLDVVPRDAREYVFLTQAARDLAETYIAENAVSRRYLIDAQHIAVATVCRADLLVSWNFRHIVNCDRIRLYNAVNLRHGYALLEIRSPREVVNED